MRDLSVRLTASRIFLLALAGGLGQPRFPFGRGFHTTAVSPRFLLPIFIVAVVLLAAPPAPPLQAQGLQDLLSDDARLSTLTVWPQDIIGFYGARRNYEVGVDPAVDVATVSATVNHAGASVVFDPADADMNTDGHQVDLSPGKNRVTVTVTAEDGMTELVYKVMVNRGQVGQWEWQAGADLDGLIKGLNEYPRGMWSDGATVWVADFVADKLFAYTLADGMRDADKDITLAAANTDPQGLWSDGKTMWVADSGEDKLFVYTLADGAWDDTQDITLDDDNGSPEGIWSNGETVWVADSGEDKLFAYTLADGAWDDTQDITLDDDNGSPEGIWSNGETVWVADSGEDKLFAYTLADGAWDDTQDITLDDDNTLPYGLWSDGTTVWVLDGSDRKLFAYTLEGGTRDADKDFDLSKGDNADLWGLWSDGTTMWVSDHDDGKLYAYTLEGGMRDADKDFDTLDDDNTSPQGLWSNGTTMWVSDTDDDSKLFAYTLEGGMRDADKDIPLHGDNDHSEGIWSNGTTIWVADFNDEKLYAYTLADGTRESDKDFDTLAADNDQPQGIWSDGTTMWVSDFDDGKLFAYTLEGGARDADKEFDSQLPLGLWSDGTTMWVSNWPGNKVFAYNLLAPSTVATLSGLTLEDGGGTAIVLDPTFAADTDTYTASVDGSIHEVTLAATTNHDGATVVIANDDDDTTPGEAVLDLSVGSNTLTVTVTAEDTTTVMSYTITVTRGASDTNATGKPGISGVAQVGQTLKATVGDMGDADGLPATFPDDYTFKWVRVDGTTETDIGTDSETYDPVADDVGHTIKVEVTFEDGGSTEETRASDPVGPVAAALGSCAAGSDWEAQMTMGYQSGLFGSQFVQRFGFEDSFNFGDLDDTLIPYGSTPYTVMQIYRNLSSTGDTIDTHSLVFHVTGGDLPDGTVLTLGETELTVGADSHRSTEGQEAWDLSSLGINPTWVDDQSMRVCANLPPRSSDATLSSLSLSDVTLSPTFTSGGITYTASVGNSVTSTMVMAQTTHSNATAVIKLNDVVDADGTVALAVGDNTITVEVTAADGIATQTYTVTVSRSLPPKTVEVSPSTVNVDEDSTETFDVHLSRQPSGNVTVTVTSSDTSAVSVQPATLSFTTASWDIRQSVTVRGLDDDDSIDDMATVRLAASGGGYDNVSRSVTVKVIDDDSCLDQTNVEFPDNRNTPGEVDIGRSLCSQVEPAYDVDWFKVDLIAGNTYVIDLEGRWTSAGTLFDPILSAIYIHGTGNSAQIAYQVMGSPRSIRDDNDGEGRNSRLMFTVVQSGRYYIAARGFASHTGTYTLTVSQRSLASLGDIVYPNGTTGHPLILLRAAPAPDPGPLGPDMPDNTTTTATVIVNGVNNGDPNDDGRYHGQIDTPNDRDWVRVWLKANKAYVIHMLGAGNAWTEGENSWRLTLPGPRIGGIFLVDRQSGDPHPYGLPGTDGEPTADRWAAGPQSAAYFTASQTGWHYIKAQAQSAVQTGTYAVHVFNLGNPWGRPEPAPMSALSTAAPPGRPQGLTGTVAHDVVSLTWDDAADASIISYQILRRDRALHNPGIFQVHVDDTGSTATSYVDRDVAAETRYVYRVRARNAAGLSAPSKSFSVDTPAAPDPALNHPATGAPTISGTPQVGETLTADTSGIQDADGLSAAVFSYQWIISLGGGTADIPGATDSTFTPEASHKGLAISVRVSFTDDAGHNETLTSATTALVLAAANSPATGAPSISGTARVGETLTADTSGIADDDGLTNVSYSYQWLAAGMDLSGATGSTYTLTSSEQGKTVQVRVSFTDDAGNNESLTSTATDEVEPAIQAQRTNSPATGVPTISGTARVGETLTAGTSAIADDDGLTRVSYSYQWIRNDGVSDTDIASASGSTYTLDAIDEGKTIKVRVSFTDDADNNETLTSAATAAIAAKPNSPATGTPTISGTARVGKTLTANTSAIADDDGLTNVSYSYQWIAAGTDLSGATGSTYTLTASEEGKTIQVRVSFTDDAENDESLTSTATAAVTALQRPGKPQGLTGTVAHDVVSLTWDDPDDASITGYQILRRDRAVHGPGQFDVHVDDTGSTATSYVDRDVAAETRYVYRIKARNAAGLSARSDYFNADTPATPNTPATGAPTISGTPQVGETLTADTSGIQDADGLTNATFSYQWIVTDGGGEIEVQGATEATYTVLSIDKALRLMVRVSFTDDAGNGESLTSAATEVVVDAEQ